ncbi:hypothetical protein ABK040_007801 [Willaertia magna]
MFILIALLSISLILLLHLYRGSLISDFFYFKLLPLYALREWNSNIDSRKSKSYQVVVKDEQVLKELKEKNKHCLLLPLDAIFAPIPLFIGIEVEGQVDDNTWIESLSKTLSYFPVIGSTIEELRYNEKLKKWMDSKDDLIEQEDLLNQLENFDILQNRNRVVLAFKQDEPMIELIITKDNEFDCDKLRYHFSNEKERNKYILSYESQMPYIKNKPLGRIHIINTKDNKTLIIPSFAHCVSDGFTIFQFMYYWANILKFKQLPENRKLLFHRNDYFIKKDELKTTTTKLNTFFDNTNLFRSAFKLVKFMICKKYEVKYYKFEKQFFTEYLQITGDNNSQNNKFLSKITHGDIICALTLKSMALGNKNWSDDEILGISIAVNLRFVNPKKYTMSMLGCFVAQIIYNIPKKQVLEKNIIEIALDIKQTIMTFDYDGFVHESCNLYYSKPVPQFNALKSTFLLGTHIGYTNCEKFDISGLDFGFGRAKHFWNFIRTAPHVLMILPKVDDNFVEINVCLSKEEEIEFEKLIN